MPKGDLCPLWSPECSTAVPDVYQPVPEGSCNTQAWFGVKTWLGRRLGLLHTQQIHGLPTSGHQPSAMAPRDTPGPVPPCHTYPSGVPHG